MVDDDDAILRLVDELLSTTRSLRGHDGIQQMRRRESSRNASSPISCFSITCCRTSTETSSTNLKENPDTSDIQIVIVSGAVDQVEIDSLFADGADSFIPKPFDPSRFLERVLNS